MLPPLLNANPLTPIPIPGVRAPEVLSELVMVIPPIFCRLPTPTVLALIASKSAVVTLNAPATPFPTVMLANGLFESSNTKPEKAEIFPPVMPGVKLMSAEVRETLPSALETVPERRFILLVPPLNVAKFTPLKPLIEALMLMLLPG